MKPPFLVTSDLHLTNNARDEYRWGIFKWLEDQVFEHGLNSVLILGDITDAKDNHSAPLVNRIVGALRSLAKVVHVKILLGNHDYLKEGHPFFEFLGDLENIDFVTEIAYDQEMLFLPYTKTPTEDWSEIDFDKFTWAFMHQTVSGAVASNGMQMEGRLRPKFETKCKIYSGDIHMPQVVGDVEYVGSPYPVHFGDRFDPRCVLISKSGEASDLCFPSIRKFTAEVEDLRQLQRYRLRAGDQLKVRIDLPPSMRADWFAVKRQIAEWCQSKEVLLCGLELVARKKRRVLLNEAAGHVREAARGPDSAVVRFAEHEKLADDIRAVGLDLIK